MNKERTLRLVIVTDAWAPQTNGVVTTLSSVIAHLPDLGLEVSVIHQGLFKTWPLPSYPEIRIARNPGKLKTLLNEIGPHAIHIATEGPLGLAARRYCRHRNIAFTTSLHTKFPEYVNLRFAIPVSVGYRFLRWFHGAANCTLVTTDSHREELNGWGLTGLKVWSRGVDTSRFVPAATEVGGKRPRLLYVGRVAVEKNIEAFLKLDIDAHKVVVGDGPARRDLEARYPAASWLGYRHGQALVDEYARADVFVFPSRTDTFGLVMLEAMACGTPVAAFPVTGPRDVVENGVNGWLDDDLASAVRGALQVDRAHCRAYACDHDWTVIATRFAETLVDRCGRKLPISRPSASSISQYAA